MHDVLSMIEKSIEEMRAELACPCLRDNQYIITHDNMALIPEVKAGVPTGRVKVGMPHEVQRLSKKAADELVVSVIKTSSLPAEVSHYRDATQFMLDGLIETAKEARAFKSKLEE